jgi:hypothetical protein
VYQGSADSPLNRLLRFQMNLHSRTTTLTSSDTAYFERDTGMVTESGLSPEVAVLLGQHKSTSDEPMVDIYLETIDVAVDDGPVIEYGDFPALAGVERGAETGEFSSSNLYESGSVDGWSRNDALEADAPERLGEASVRFGV